MTFWRPRELDDGLAMGIRERQDSKITPKVLFAEMGKTGRRTYGRKSSILEQ